MTEHTDEQLPLAVPSTWTPTGDVRVDTAVEVVSAIGELPLAEHPQVFEDVHRRLSQTLADASGA